MAYGRVDESFWHDDKIRSLSRDGRDMLLYLLTCPHRNRLGCFVLDPFYATADLQWKRDEVEAALRELADAGRIGFDPHNRVVFICNYIKHNPPENGNVVKAAIRELRSLPDTPLIGLLAQALQNHSRPHFEDLERAVGLRVENLGDEVPDDLLAQGLRNGSANHSPNGLPNRGLGNGKGSSSKKEKDTTPLDSLWDTYLDELGGDGRQPTLTQKRKKKLRALHDEQLSTGDEDPVDLFRKILQAVKSSDHHMSERAYQMPESLFRNAERRERWMLQAAEGGNGRYWSRDL